MKGVGVAQGGSKLMRMELSYTSNVEVAVLYALPSRTFGDVQGRRKELFNVNFKKIFFGTDLCPNTLYRKCLKCPPPPLSN